MRDSSRRTPCGSSEPGSSQTHSIRAATCLAERLIEYSRLGITHFILSGYPHVEEAYWFGEGVLPILERRGLWRRSADREERFAPGQVGVGVSRGDRSRRAGGTTEEHWRQRVGVVVQQGVGHLQVCAGEAERFARLPQSAHDVQEFPGAFVALLLVEEIAEGTLFVRFAAGHHVEQ